MGADLDGAERPASVASPGLALLLDAARAFRVERGEVRHRSASRRAEGLSPALPTNWPVPAPAWATRPVGTLGPAAAGTPPAAAPALLVLARRRLGGGPEPLTLGAQLPLSSADGRRAAAVAAAAAAAAAAAVASEAELASIAPSRPGCAVIAPTCARASCGFIHATAPCCQARQQLRRVDQRLGEERGAACVCQAAGAPAGSAESR